jgi:CheY-like chemotaxis protein
MRERIVAGENDRAEMVQRVETLTHAEAERAGLQARVEELSEELSQSRKEVQGLEGRISQIDEANDRLIAESRKLYARIESLSKGGETLEQEKQAAISAAQQRVTELESALGRMAKTLNTARTTSAEELSKAREELATANQERERLQQELAAGREELEARTRALAETTAERERSSGEAEQLREERTRLTQSLEINTAEAEKLAQEFAESNRRIEKLEAELKGIVEVRDALTRELKETRERLTAEAEEKLTAAEAARQELKTALEAEREARGTEVASLNDQLAQVRAELSAQLEEMVARHQATEAAAQAECERLSQALAEKETLLHSIEEDLATGEPTEGQEGVADESEVEMDLDSLLMIDRSVGEEELLVEREEAAGTEAEGTGALPEEVVILDAPETGESTAQRLAEFGYKTTALSPNGEFAAHIEHKSVACTAINLGMPTGWRALRLLRTSQGGMGSAVVAYALAPGAPNGFWFGPVDFVRLPVTESVTELLQRMIPNVRRALAMSADLDVMSDVREELNKGRISTAVVLDGRQALDLVPTVRPEAAVLHLSPSSTDVFRAIAGLRNSDFGRDIPILFLLDSEPQEREEAFLTAGIRMLSGRGNMKADELIEALAEILSPYRPPD